MIRFGLSHANIGVKNILLHAYYYKRNTSALVLYGKNLQGLVK